MASSLANSLGRFSPTQGPTRPSQMSRYCAADTGLPPTICCIASAVLHGWMKKYVRPVTGWFWPSTFSRRSGCQRWWRACTHRHADGAHHPDRLHLRLEGGRHQLLIDGLDAHPPVSARVVHDLEVQDRDTVDGRVQDVIFDLDGKILIGCRGDVLVLSFVRAILSLILL